MCLVTRAQLAARKRRVAPILVRPLLDLSVLFVLEPKGALPAKAGDGSANAEEAREARGHGERGHDKHDDFKRGDHHLNLPVMVVRATPFERAHPRPLSR
jgi:hypothetical protein